MDPAIIQDIFKIKEHRTFRETALKVFYFQAAHNPVYREYLAALGIDPGNIKELEQIPFLPVEFFKTHSVICEGMTAEVVFESSGTTRTGTCQASHCRCIPLQEKAFTEGFSRFYGSPEKFCILALLPSYLERSGSSLVYMMDHLIKQSGHPDGGFYLDNLSELVQVLQKRKEDRHPTLLGGGELRAAGPGGEPSFETG